MCRTCFWLLFAALALTSNISNAIENSLNNNVKVANVTTDKSLQAKLVEHRSNSTNRSNDFLQKSASDQHMPINDEPIITEGGSINAPSNSKSTLVKNETKKSSAKIVPRKGANALDIFTSTSTQIPMQRPNLTTVQVTQKTPQVAPKVKINTPNITSNNKSNNSTVTKANSTELGGKQAKVKGATKPVNGTRTTVSTTIATVTTKNRKPKPTVTIGDSEDDTPIRSSAMIPKKERKIDYIVPVIVGVVILPILSIVLYVLYRRGRDCWDKRHYRRMDFLIDGMYNE